MLCIQWEEYIIDWERVEDAFVKKHVGLWEEPRGQESLKYMTYCKVARLVPIYQWSGYRCTSADSWKNDAIESAFILCSLSSERNGRLRERGQCYSSCRYFSYRNSRRRRRYGESSYFQSTTNKYPWKINDFLIHNRKKNNGYVENLVTVKIFFRKLKPRQYRKRRYTSNVNYSKNMSRGCDIWRFTKHLIENR